MREGDSHRRTHPGYETEERILHASHRFLEELPVRRWNGRHTGQSSRIPHQKWSRHYRWGRVFQSSPTPWFEPMLAWRLCVVNRLDKIRPLEERLADVETKVEALRRVLEETLGELEKMRQKNNHLKAEISSMKCLHTPGEKECKFKPIRCPGEASSANSYTPPTPSSTSIPEEISPSSASMSSPPWGSLGYLQLSTSVAMSPASKCVPSLPPTPAGERSISPREWRQRSAKSS